VSVWQPSGSGFTRRVDIAGYKQSDPHVPNGRPCFGFCRHLVSPFREFLIEHIGMKDLHEPMVVVVIHRDADNHRAWHFESPLDGGGDLIGRFYP